MRSLRTAATTALLLVAVPGCGPAQDSAARPGGPPDATGTWRQLPEAPLTARDHAVVVGVGEHVLVVGGWEFLCPPMADCATPDAPLLDDGAVYDRATDSWSTVTPAPFGVRRAEHATTAVGGSAYVLTGCADGPMCSARPRLLSYDLAGDRWTDHGTVPGPAQHRQLTAVGRTVLAYGATDEHGEAADLVFDPDRSSWTELPDDPLPRAFDRFVVPVGGQLVLTGSSTAALEAGEDTSKPAARFDLDRGTWVRLPDAPGQGYQLLPTDRGPLLNGHFIDAPGWLLDPQTWSWSAVPGQDGERHDLSGVVDRDRATYDIPNSVGEMTSSMRVHLYDSGTGSLLTLPALPGREDVHDDSSTALGRDLFVYGGQRWTGDGVDAADGELVGDAWLWTAPPHRTGSPTRTRPGSSTSP